MNKAPSSPVLRTLGALFEGRSGGCLVSLIVIPLLIFFALILPPISLPQRLFGAGYTGVSAKGGAVTAADGTVFSIPEGGAKNGASIKLTSMSRDEFIKNTLSKSLPAGVDVKSALYQPGVQGTAPTLAVLSIPIPERADPWRTLDVYGYSGKKWTKLPFQIYADARAAEKERLEVSLINGIPEGIVIAQTQPQAPAISADVSAKNTLPALATQVVGEVNPIGLTIADAGGVAGSVPSIAEASANSPYQVLPTVSNLVADQIRSDLTDIMITDPQLRKQHIQALVDLAVEKLYPGLLIDYQGTTPENKNDLSAFVRELAQALHAKDKLLGVTLAMPVAKSADTWDTGPFDWAAIGQAADIIEIPLPMAPSAYNGNPSLVQNYLQWAVGKIDRAKIELAFPISGRDEFGTSYAPISLSNTLGLMGPLNVTPAAAAAGAIIFDLPRLREAGLNYDTVTGLYSFAYRDAKGQQHTVYLESADSLSRKLTLALQYNLRGVALREVLADGIDARAWDVLKQYRQAQPPSAKANLALVWRVNGQVVGKSSPTDPKFSWMAPAQAGEQNVDVAFSFDDGQSVTGKTVPVAIQVASAVPTSKPAATSQATKAASTSSTAPQPTTAAAGAKPTATPKPTTAAPPPVTSNTAPRANFGYGMQVNGGDPGGEAADLKSLGFNWVKIQVPWQDFESSKGVANLSSVDNFVNIMSANGIKVLLSIVKAPAWSRQQNGLISQGNGPPDNMQDAADFMGGVAGMYCGKVGAIEVWNEENLDVEWHDKRGVSAALYMDMLKKAYSAIKSKCPSMVVVSGAGTPTGGGGSTAIDDVEYLRQLYANGLKNYSDAIGAHPSGFRSSPECKLSTPGCAGPYADHRSFFFRDTMESYRAVMAANGDGGKQIWATEFGWPVGTGGGAHPAGQYNNAEAVAGYYARAYQWARTQSWIGVMFAWCWDFSGGEVGAFRIKGTPAENALRSMPK